MAIRGWLVLVGGRTSPRKASPWKVCPPEKKEPPPPWWSPGAASEAPRVSGAMREGAAQPPAPPGGAASVVGPSGSPKSPPAWWPRWFPLRSSAPLGPKMLAQLVLKGQLRLPPRGGLSCHAHSPTHSRPDATKPPKMALESSPGAGMPHCHFEWQEQD